jgi:putative transposase
MPRLLATAPNQVWTWDIAKLPTRKRGEYLSLYVIMDLFSRHIVAWMLSRKENSALSSQLIDEAAQRYDIGPGKLTLHQDRGAPMTAHCYLDLLSELAITASHSRPRVSNDNPMSEAQFKTLKYQPDYPRRFDHYDHAMRWCNDYVEWYNHMHHHSSLEGFTPAQVFTGRYVDIARVRQEALNEAFAAHPERDQCYVTLASRTSSRGKRSPNTVHFTVSSPHKDATDRQLLQAEATFNSRR